MPIDDCCCFCCCSQRKFCLFSFFALFCMYKFFTQNSPEHTFIHTILFIYSFLFFSLSISHTYMYIYIYIKLFFFSDIFIVDMQKLFHWTTSARKIVLSLLLFFSLINFRSFEGHTTNDEQKQYKIRKNTYSEELHMHIARTIVE